MTEFSDRKRVVISVVKPELDAGRFPIRRVAGDRLIVEADIIADGHDILSAVLLYRKAIDSDWHETPMQVVGQDRWRGSFVVQEVGQYVYTVVAWVDRFKSWRRDLTKRLDGERQEDVSVNLLVGAELIAEASARADPDDIPTIGRWATELRSRDITQEKKVDLALSDIVSQLMDRYSDRRFAVQYLHELIVSVDREKARYSTWYEMFPRSCAAKPGQHGTFRDCEEQLSRIAGMGFDTLYFPPIHPVGHTNRKGRNNSVSAGQNDPGTPWAIGTAEGGHKAIHPKLGTIEDLHRLIRKADEHGMEIALDLAFQCSPDHPYVKDHPAWFVWRPDGSIQFAENPPKKYQDIYPLNFESDDWQGLWEELKSVVMFWIEQGIRVFRVDNPHTKSFYFWEWLIASVKKDHPDVIFLAEAFTRPIVMYQLAKLGFDQSYTYFAWRNTKWELTQYFTELTRSEVNEFFRPNLWPNTPDILTEYLQFGGRPAFMARLVLAATLGASYGIYGPAFELCENQPREPGSEEYLDSEKYELKHWDIDRPGNLGDFIARVNRIRRENPTLQSNSNLEFHPVDNTELICFSKHTDDLSDTVLVVVNLDPHHVHSGWIELPLEELKLDMRQPYQVHDLLTEARFLWQGPRNYVELDPAISPAHIFRLRRRMRTERDFDYYM